SSSARLRAQGDLTVGNVTATNVSIDSDAGSLINAASSTKNVTATNLRLQAQNSIGTSARHLTTNIDNVTALAATGSIYLTEDNGATVTNVTVSVTDFTSSAGTTTVTDAAQSDLTTGLNGNIVLVATLGDLTLNDGSDADGITVTANGTGNILLDSVAGSVTANADILSGSGHITVLAAQSATFVATADVTTGGSGTIYVSGIAANVTQADNSRFTAVNGDVRIVAGGTITLGGVTTNTNLSLIATSGSIVDAGDVSGGDDIIAASLRAIAGVGIGGSSSVLETALGTVSAQATSGGIYLREANAITVGITTATIQQFGANATLTPVTDAAQAGLVTTAGNGAISLTTLAGSITVSSVITAHGSGSVTLAAAGSSSDVSLGAVVSSTTGAMGLTAGARILETTSDENPVLRTGGVLTLSATTGLGQTGRGDLDVSAPSLNFTNSGAGMAYFRSHLAGATVTSASLAGNGSLIFTQLSGGLILAGPVTVSGGSATFRVAGSLTLNSVNLNASADLNLSAQSVGLTSSSLTAGTTGNLRIATSGAFVSDAGSTLTGGNISAATGGALTLGQVNATGLLDIQAAGSVTTSSASTSLVAGQLRLVTSGDAGTTLLPLRVNAGASDVRVSGLLNIVNLNSLTLGRGGLDFTTATGGEQVISVQGTSINSIGGQILDHGTGTIRIEAASDLTLNTKVTSENGSITVNATSLTDGTVDEGAIFSAVNGRVTLNTQTGIGASGAGDIDFVAREIQATTQTGDLALEALATTKVAGTGLKIASSGASGNLSLTTSTGNLNVWADVTNAGSGGISLSVPQGAFTMTTGSVVSASTGTISVNSSGLMTLHRVTNTTGIISLGSQDAITTVAVLNYANVTSLTRPNLTLVNSINIIVNSNSVFATGPQYPSGVNISRGGSDDIDMSIYSSILTGND
ncbi:MAG: hypothetical protein NTU80_02300, partial [Verrucomicrobia bacterium]|nr:hypothetical protein [Verrucomicrobiota bacterium]